MHKLSKVLCEARFYLHGVHFNLMNVSKLRTVMMTQILYA